VRSSIQCIICKTGYLNLRVTCRGAVEESSWSQLDIGHGAGKVTILVVGPLRSWRLSAALVCTAVTPTVVLVSSSHPLPQPAPRETLISVMSACLVLQKGKQFLYVLSHLHHPHIDLRVSLDRMDSRRKLGGGSLRQLLRQASSKGEGSYPVLRQTSTVSFEGSPSAPVQGSLSGAFGTSMKQLLRKQQSDSSEVGRPSWPVDVGAGSLNLASCRRVAAPALRRG
jgi:hypothetical protein